MNNKQWKIGDLVYTELTGYATIVDLFVSTNKPNTWVYEIKEQLPPNVAGVGTTCIIYEDELKSAFEGPQE